MEIIWSSSMVESWILIHLFILFLVYLSSVRWTRVLTVIILCTRILNENSLKGIFIFLDILNIHLNLTPRPLRFLENNDYKFPCLTQLLQVFSFYLLSNKSLFITYQRNSVSRGWKHNCSITLQVFCIIRTHIVSIVSLGN